MNIHEYQAKAVLRDFGVAVPRGHAAFSVDEAVKAAADLGAPVLVVKAQIHAGGRGKAGGVKVVKSIEDVEKEAKRLLGSTLVTHQTGPKGKVVNRIYVEEGSAIEKEFYLSMLVDRGASRVAIVASTEGGMDIEQVAHDTPDKIVTVSVDPVTGVCPHHVRTVAQALKLDADLGKQLGPLLANFVPQSGAALQGRTQAHGTLLGPLKDPKQVNAELQIPTFSLAYQSLEIANAAPIRIDYRGGTATLQPAQFKGTDTDLQLQATVPIESQGDLHASATRTHSLRQLAALVQRDQQERKVPVFVAGDFNADPDQIDTTQGMSPNFVDSWFVAGQGSRFTSFVPNPTMKIDYWFSDASGRARARCGRYRASGFRVRARGRTHTYGDLPLYGSSPVLSLSQPCALGGGAIRSRVRDRQRNVDRCRGAVNRYAGVDPGGVSRAHRYRRKNGPLRNADRRFLGAHCLTRRQQIASYRKRSGYRALRIRRRRRRSVWGSQARNRRGGLRCFYG